MVFRDGQQAYEKGFPPVALGALGVLFVLLVLQVDDTTQNDKLFRLASPFQGKRRRS